MLHEEQSSYLLLCHPSLTYPLSPSLKDIPPSIVALLQDFQDVFPKDIPYGLPLTRGIEHQSDFVIGASVPNILAYRINPIETKEIESQVNDLLEKGWEQMSLSPCVVGAQER